MRMGSGGGGGGGSVEWVQWWVCDRDLRRHARAEPPVSECRQRTRAVYAGAISVQQSDSDVRRKLP